MGNGLKTILVIAVVLIIVVAMYFLLIKKKTEGGASILPPAVNNPRGFGLSSLPLFTQTNGNGSDPRPVAKTVYTKTFNSHNNPITQNDYTDVYQQMQAWYVGAAATITDVFGTPINFNYTTNPALGGVTNMPNSTNLDFIIFYTKNT